MRTKNLPKSTALRLTLTIILAIVCLTGVKAQPPTYYFPGSNVNYTGGSNSFPLNSTSSNKCQWLYKNTDFNTTLPGALLITRIYIKPSATRTNQSITGLTIKLANSSLTTLSSGAWLTGLTTVYSPATVTVSTTANSWFGITLPIPFYYSGGNILMEISQSGAATGITINQYTVSGRNGRKYGSLSSTSASGVDAATCLFGFDGAPASCSGTPLSPIVTTAPMNPAAPICAGNTMSLTASDPNAPITNISYRWQSAPSSTGPWSNVSTGTGATTLNYTTGPLAATTWFRMGALCNSSSITSYSAAYQVTVGASQPGIISGRATFCPGDTTTYSVPAVFGHTYTWTLPTGWTGTSTSNSILVTMGSSTGTISVTATGCGGTSIARTKSIMPGSAPGTPGAVTGPTHVCGSSTQTFSVPPVVGATYYTWTLPSGWTGTSTSNTITVQTGAASGSVRVKGGNGCGTSANSSKSVTVITSLASPGPITATNANNGPTGGQYCSGALYNFSISPVVGATSYQWVLPTGWTGVNNGTSIQAFAGGSGGTIQVTAYVSCATSPAATLSTPVSNSVVPSVSVSPNAPTICTGKPNTFTASPTNGGSAPTYQWQKNGVNVTGSGVTYTDASLVTGDRVSVIMTSNAFCRSADTIRSNRINITAFQTVTPGISINSNPVITLCAGTTLNFSTTVTGAGTAPTYQWYRNGLPISGATSPTYSSSGFANGDTITVNMTSSAICTSVPVGNSNKIGLIVNPSVVPTINITTSSTVTGQSVTFTATQSGGGATPDYQWILNGVNIPGETDDTYTTSTLVPGDHVSVRMLSYADCASPASVVSNEIIMGSPTSIASAGNWDGSISLYPNPSTGRFTIAANWSQIHIGKKVTLDVYNLMGQMVHHAELTPDKSKWSHTIQLAETITNGHYTVKLITSDGITANLPVVITR